MSITNVVLAIALVMLAVVVGIPLSAGLRKAGIPINP